MQSLKQHVYIIGSKGIPAKYGGFETFVEKLTEYQTTDEIVYHVACTLENSKKSNITSKHFTHNGADCFNIDVPSIGPAKAIYYDVAALDYSIKMAKKNKDKNPIFYILACRIGPFISIYKKKIEKLGGKLLVNPDGHEWLREKWSKPVRKYWKLSEKFMVKEADTLICDSKNIKKYVDTEYLRYNPNSIYISYGTDMEKSNYTYNNIQVKNWFDKHNIEMNQYYLVVGRFVPENNYESMIKEYMKSETKKDFVIITNVEKNKFYDKLLMKTQFNKDSRIKFVGTVYDQELLKYIRENSFAYIHGHEVGGTNPSLLEALYFTNLNLLLNVGFNQEVAEDSAVYWNKDSLHTTINELEKKDSDFINELNVKSTKIIEKKYNWLSIVEQYENFFMSKEV